MTLLIEKKVTIKDANKVEWSNKIYHRKIPYSAAKWMGEIRSLFLKFTSAPFKINSFATFSAPVFTKKFNRIHKNEFSLTFKLNKSKWNNLPDIAAKWSGLWPKRSAPLTFAPLAINNCATFARSTQIEKCIELNYCLKFNSVGHLNEIDLVIVNRNNNRLLVTTKWFKSKLIEFVFDFVRLWHTWNHFPTGFKDWSQNQNNKKYRIL